MSSDQTRWQNNTSLEVNVSAEETESTYPFLVHSQQSLSQKAPPDIDNHRLARQKRRRTSPEDHAILEAEYERNSKPDKLARLQIVRKVALGQKEVQIWFQNRRQVARRKSRPLLPHEILPNLQLPSQSSEHTPSSSDHVAQSSQQTRSSSGTSVASCPSQPSDVDVGVSSQALRLAAIQDQVRSGQGHSSITDTSLNSLGPEPNQVVGVRNNEVTAVNANCGVGALRNIGLSRSKSQTLPRTRRPEAFGSRRSASFMVNGKATHTGCPSVSTPAPKDMEQSQGPQDAAISSQSINRASSLIRLSMSIDGKAQVTTGSGTSPSPPRPQPASFLNPPSCPTKGLRRSFSAIEPGKKDSCSSFSNSTVRRHATGRSRDARTWEFYCDKDARDALTEQAEREESGSATAAIALIMSNSNVNKARAVATNKRNAHAHKLEAAKKLKVNGQTMRKPKLGRSQSLYDDMHAVNKTSRSIEMKAGMDHRKYDSQSAIFEIYEGDSDKENWVPGTQQRDLHKLLPTGPTRSRRLLEESLRHSSNQGASMSQERNVSSGLSSMKSTSSVASEEKENRAPKIDDGGAAFTNDSVAPREADDLDCVQNLLSLSQATWQ